MRKRSEATKPAAPKPSAAARTAELPLEKKIDLVSHDGMVTCPTCDEIVLLGKCTKRDNGTFECCECGGVIDDVAITSSTTTSDHARNNVRAAARTIASEVIDNATASAANVDVNDGPPAREVERMSPPVAMRSEVVHEGETSELLEEVPLSEIDAPRIVGASHNGGLAGYCGECGAAWPFLNGELLKSCGHTDAARVEHPTEAKKIRPSAGQQMQDTNSPRARPMAVTNAHNTSAAPTPTNRISVPWGEARCPVDQYNNFKCGGFIVTVDLAPGEDRVKAAEAILADLEKIADIAFQRQHAWYLKKLGLLGVPSY